MLKKLRWRFIGIATMSVALVLLLLIVGINLSFRIQNDRNADSMLRVITENRGTIPSYSEQKRSGSPERPSFTPETPFDTRFFSVWLDETGQIVSTQMEHIRAVTAENAEQYVRQALQTGDEYGSVERYRFCRSEDEGRTLIVFLDCFRNQSMARSLLRISLILAVAVLLGAALFVFLFSRRAIAPMVRSVERQQRFITDASHEIKTPVTVIGSYASLMVMEDPDNEWAKTIEKETGRLSALVTDLVKLSRWDEEGTVTDKTRFSLSEAVWDLLPTYQKLAAARGLTLETEVQEDVEAAGDEGAIQNAIAVLLENAVKYAVPDSTIRFELEKKRKTAGIRVANTTDLPQDQDLDRLFDRFYRADPSRTRSSGGSGVGLSLARAIAEAHKGTISARREGDRITFELFLPI